MYSKNYVPEDVIEFIKKNIEPKIVELSKGIDILINHVMDCEEHFHGVGKNSLIRAAYSELYETIGYCTDDGKGQGFWYNCNILSKLSDEIKRNALEDKRIDEEGA